MATGVRETPDGFGLIHIQIPVANKRFEILYPDGEYFRCLISHDLCIAPNLDAKVRKFFDVDKYLGANVLITSNFDSYSILHIKEAELGDGGEIDNQLAMHSL